jgi:hypothetical protein
LEIILFYVLFNRRRREEEAVRAMEEARRLGENIGLKHNLINTDLTLKVQILECPNQTNSTIHNMRRQKLQ